MATKKKTSTRPSKKKSSAGASRAASKKKAPAKKSATATKKSVKKSAKKSAVKKTAKKSVASRPQPSTAPAVKETEKVTQQHMDFSSHGVTPPSVSTPEYSRDDQQKGSLPVVAIVLVVIVVIVAFFVAKDAIISPTDEGEHVEQVIQPEEQTPAAPEENGSATEETSQETTEVSAPAAPTTYTVKPGDTLRKIARTKLGDSKRWEEIFIMNRDKLPDESAIKVGQTLKIPAK